MKFFIPLGFRYENESYQASHVNSVYGPYKDDQAVEEAIACLWPNDDKSQFLVFEGQIIGTKKPGEAVGTVAAQAVGAQLTARTFDAGGIAAAGGEINIR